MDEVLECSVNPQFSHLSCQTLVRTWLLLQDLWWNQGLLCEEFCRWCFLVLRYLSWLVGETRKPIEIGESFCEFSCWWTGGWRWGGFLDVCWLKEASGILGVNITYLP
ncbi:unnamed protein product [Moneuplotes crassus]|uniref:Uncharacterized protein n=1 Tax=Euplotes crassus TaxID=5936 RepID=A0AAD1Y0Q0_EUPCR|nr:unnamed protein product [Moneuplotes crassus]